MEPSLGPKRPRLKTTPAPFESLVFKSPRPPTKKKAKGAKGHSGSSQEGPKSLGTFLTRLDAYSNPPILHGARRCMKCMNPEMSFSLCLRGLGLQGFDTRNLKTSEKKRARERERDRERAREQKTTIETLLCSEVRAPRSCKPKPFTQSHAMMCDGAFPPRWQNTLRVFAFSAWRGRRADAGLGSRASRHFQTLLDYPDYPPVRKQPPPLWDATHASRC